MKKNDTLLQAFEWYLPDDSQHWNKLKVQAPSFSNLGVTLVWLPPAYKGAGGVHDVGYGVYDLYDLGEFDQKGTIPTKYGTKQEYLDAIDALQKENISVLADIVLNQKMGGDTEETIDVIKSDSNNRNEEIGGDYQITAWTKFTFQIDMESTLHLPGMQVILMVQTGMRRRNRVPSILLKERTGIQM